MDKSQSICSPPLHYAASAILGWFSWAHKCWKSFAISVANPFTKLCIVKTFHIGIFLYFQERKSEETPATSTSGWLLTSGIGGQILEMAMLLGHVSVLDCCQVTLLEFVFMVALLPQGGGGNEGGEHSVFPLMLMPHHTQVQFSSVTQSCPTLWDPMDCSIPGLPVYHQLPEFTQIHVHWISVYMPSSHLILCCPLLQPSIFPSIRVFSNESVLHIRWPKYWSFSFSISPSNKYSGLISLGWPGWISLQSKGLSRVFSNTTLQKHQFFGAQLSLQSKSHIHTWLLEKP